MNLASVQFALIAIIFRFLECYAAEVHIGANLTLGESWTSGPFSLGLHSSNTAGLFELAIWFTAPDTVIWVDKRQVSATAFLVLQKDGLAVIDNHKQNNIFSCSACVASGYFLETGNFLLKNSSNDIVWESFSFPTDTLLTEQQMVGNTSLSSRSGRYSLRLAFNQVALFYENYPGFYWKLGNSKLTAAQTNSSVPPRLELSRNGTIAFYDDQGNSPYYYKYDRAQQFTTDYNTNATRRLVLEEIGNLRVYTLLENNTWKIVWQAKLLECEIYGICGPFGICGYSPKQTCSCPPGFVFNDKTDNYAGCGYKVPLNCSNSKLIRTDRLNIIGNDLSNATNITMEACKQRCLKDCDCLGLAYTIDGSAQCFLKGNNGSTSKVLYNALQNPVQLYVAFFKVSKADTKAVDLTGPGPFVTYLNTELDSAWYSFVKKEPAFFSKRLHVVTFTIAIVELVLFLVFTFVFWTFWHRLIKKMWKKQFDAIAVEDVGAPIRFTYEQLQFATDNFSQELGSGGFGTVFKGVLVDEIVVAVKRLHLAPQAEQQFQAEVATFGKIHHMNLVRLLGYCVHKKQRMLVYEFMVKGSLKEMLFSDQGDEDKRTWNWPNRLAIATGVARGLAYLHEECLECILHCDIKPENVLLDQDLHPKVSDFGMAKFMSHEEVLSITTIRGTRGYLAPEWLSNMPITAKADVYSFGLVLLEILSGKDKFLDQYSGSTEVKTGYPSWAFQKYKASEIKSIVDHRLLPTLSNWAEFDRALQIAFWCIQVDANSRPTMGKVVQMLEGAIPVEPVPI